MIQAVLSRITYAIVGMPMYAVFRHGPAFAGCWQGRPDEDICAELTNTEASFWKINDEQCAEIINRKFNSFYVVASAAGYAYFMITALNLSMRMAILRWMAPQNVDDLSTLSRKRGTSRTLK